MSIYSLITALYVQLLIHAFGKVLANGFRTLEQTCRCVNSPIYAERTNVLIGFEALENIFECLARLDFQKLVDVDKSHPRMLIFVLTNALFVNPPLEKARWTLGDLGLIIMVESQGRARNRVIIKGRKRRIRPVIHDVEVAHIHVVVVMG